MFSLQKIYISHNKIQMFSIGVADFPWKSMQFQFRVCSISSVDLLLNFWCSLCSSYGGGRILGRRQILIRIFHFWGRIFIVCFGGCLSKIVFFSFFIFTLRCKQNNGRKMPGKADGICCEKTTLLLDFCMSWNFAGGRSASPWALRWLCGWRRQIFCIKLQLESMEFVQCIFFLFFRRLAVYIVSG